ncbi:MAG TPA: FAD/NAD(P)-binding protein, partial [Pirellula sp.]|nr:FAD/NAD(P)-binding protein [Pirellula sp.]
MSKLGRLAIIGVGPSAIFLLKHLLGNIDRFQTSLRDVYLFDKRATLGTGMPYDRKTTDKYNLCNISSAEIPLLNQSLAGWLHPLSDEELALQEVQRSEIDEDETYRRTTLGDYFHAQYRSIVEALRAKGLTLHERSDCLVTDVIDHRPSECVEIRFSNEESIIVERVVISTGHSFLEPDAEENGYYASP